MNQSLKEPLTPHQRVFGTLRNVVEVVASSADLNSARACIKASLERALSWESELCDVPPVDQEPDPDVGRVVPVEEA